MNERTGGNGMKVLLIEESETCAECLLGIYNRRWFCLATGKDIDLLKSRYEKPTWCPLRPLPTKKEHSEEGNPCSDNYEDEYEYEYREGYNTCLREITGETK